MTRLGVTIAWMVGVCSACRGGGAPQVEVPPTSGAAFCYEGDASRRYLDSASACARSLAACEQARAAIGGVGAPPPAGVSACTRRASVVCVAYEVARESGSVVQETCHTTQADCARAEAALAADRATTIARGCHPST